MPSDGPGGCREGPGVFAPSLLCSMLSFAPVCFSDVGTRSKQL